MKYTLKWVILQILVLIGIPVLSIYVVPADAGMIGMIVMFMGINPLFFAIQGVSLGGDLKRRWFLLPLALVIFPAGVGLWLGAPLDQLMLYEAVYLVVGLVAAVLSAVAEKKRK